MTIQLADILYPVNSTTVDTGTGIDIRLLDSAQAGADDTSQSAQFTNTNDNVNRTFDPATASVTNTNDAETTLFKRGWALRLAEDMTPIDDTNCNAVLLPGVLRVNLVMNLDQTGGTYLTGSYLPNIKTSLWRYNPSTDTGTLILGAHSSAIAPSDPTWDLTPGTGNLGTDQNYAIDMNIPSMVEFSPGEILLLQVGFNTQTIPNPTLGTATFTFVLVVDTANTNIDFATGQGIRSACVLTHNLTGSGVSSKTLNVSLTRSSLGSGIVSHTKSVIVSKTFNITSDGLTTHSKLVLAQRSFDLTGVGTTTVVKDVMILRNTVGDGIISGTKSVVASKTLTAVGSGVVSREGLIAALLPRTATGKGVVTETHPVQAFRTFHLTGIGVTSGRIELPIDEVPTGGGGTITYIRPIFLFDD